MRKRDDFEVRSDLNGLTLLARGRTVWTTSWAAVQRVRAYQSDDFSVDTRWLEFEAPGGPLRVSEDVRGYSDLEASLTAFLGVPPKWQAMVAKSAFDRNETVIFDRATGETTGGI